MLICEQCQQGCHLGCFGLAAVPDSDEDYWVCEGCKQLQQLAPGQHVVIEAPQIMYGAGQDPHLAQGLFEGSIRSLVSPQGAS